MAKWDKKRWMACELPERVLQFGTGGLLRGLPDYFIDKANREGVFNGRMVVVKSKGLEVTCPGYPLICETLAPDLNKQ